MNYLPDTKIFENNDIEIYSNKKIPDDFLERLSNFFSKKKKSILDFFKITSFIKVRINLFDNKTSYYNFSTQYIRISSYSQGNCCAGMINYVYNESDFQNFAKARFSYCKYRSRICTFSI